MSDLRTGIDFTSDNPEEQQLWEQLNGLDQDEPSPRLRQNFYRDLDRKNNPTLLDRCRDWFGLNGSHGLITASACLFVGLALGQISDSSNAPTASPDFLSLQQQVDDLNRYLVLDRLESTSANKRLLGVVTAAKLVEQDPEVARAVLARALDDKVYSVRSAAIDALGSQMNNPEVANELMTSLENPQSPLVQLALVDLILRYGNKTQIEQLLRLSDSSTLDPELSKHVQNSLGRTRA